MPQLKSAIKYRTVLLPLTLLAGFFIHINTANAQVTCGEIITPANLHTGQAEVREPIENCADPFLVTPDVQNPYQIVVNGGVVPDGGTVLVPGGLTDAVVVQGTPYLTSYNVEYFRHDGPNYIRVRTHYDEVDVPRSELYRHAESYFFGSTIRAFYQQLIASSDRNRYFYDVQGKPLYDSEGEIIADRYQQFIDDALATIQIPFGPGTYTAVVTEYSLVLTQRNLWDKIVTNLVPTAYASNEGNGWPQRYVFSITFTITAEPEVPAGASSVLFLPGIQASLLETNGDQLWIPHRNQDVEQLAMDSAGNSINDVYTTGIMTHIPFGGTVYDSFARLMVSLVQERVIAGWTPFAYDWRYSVADIANNGTKYEEGVRDAIAEIEYLASRSFTGRVTIIGHSNGGLLAKALMIRLEAEGKAQLVDKVVLLAVPQLGTPKAIGTILHGYDQEKLGGWLIDDVTARAVIQNMPGAYGLLPSEKYLSVTTDKVVSFDNSTTTQVFRNNYGLTIDSIAELRRFLIGVYDGRLQATTIDEVLNANNALLTESLELHRNVLGNWLAPAGVEVVEIIGTGLDTVSGFEYRGFQKRDCVLFIFNCQIKGIYKPVPIISQKGDSTVMSLSAEAYRGNKASYFIDLNAAKDRGGNSKHHNISENPSVQKLIKNLLLATTTDIEFISNTQPNSNEERIMFGVHSPAEIILADAAGNIVGKRVVNGAVTKEEAIRNSSYFEIGTSKYVIVPRNATYNITIIGTGDGSVTFTQDNLTNNTQIAKYSVMVATITASTTIKASFNTDLSNLEIDRNSDGNIDLVLTPLGEDITPRASYRDLSTRINQLAISRVRKLPLQILVDNARRLDEKSLINPRITPLEILLLSRLETLLVTYQKRRWISRDDLDALNHIINQLK